MNKAFFAYLFVMALTTYFIRMIPFTLLRNKIKSAYIQSLAVKTVLHNQSID